MSVASYQRARAATRRALEPGSPGFTRIVTTAVIVVVSAVAADGVAGMNGHLPKQLLLLLVLAGGAVLLTISAEQLLLAWLVLGSLLAESSSGKTRLGHVLSLGLYTAPPIVFSIKTLATRGWRPARRWFDAVPALFVAFVVVSVPLTESSALHSGLISTLRGIYQNVALGIIVYYVVAFWRGRALSMVRILHVLLLTALLQAGMAVIELGTHWNLWHDTSWQQAGDDRSIATLTNPAVTGGFIGVGIVIALAVLCWQGPSHLHSLSKLMLLVGIVGLFATKTRGPIIATAVVAIAIVFMSSRGRLLGIGVAAAAALAIFAFWPQIKSSSLYTTRIDQKSDVEARLVLQEVSFKLAEEKPLFGWGYNSFDRVKYDVTVPSTTLPLSTALQSTSHDTYLTILVEYGGVGLLLFVLPWLAVMLPAARRLRVPSPERWFLVAALGGILEITIDGGTIDYRFFSYVPMIAWLLLGLLRRQDAELARRASAPAG